MRVLQPEGSVLQLGLCQEQCRLLCQQYARLLGAGEVPKPMAPSVEALLMSQFGSLMCCSQSQELRMAAAAGRNVNETEMRVVWDRILLEFFVDQPTAASPNVLYVLALIPCYPAE